ncbi:hypothetical protein [Chryseobacterium vrystaatense]|uniref:Immunity protein 35 n=1 Tax=Chryseobacterium vrystaatense TaxID=307480 RepID=A0ABR4UHS1_9FLAO|nr:hypothetical protein [Chryseobacterium vrystaatense]KFF24135.1 hypothetical protein IW16_22495 [Chryseobacterium vrystaatense]
MERHHRIFNQITELLQKKLGERIKVYEENGSQYLELTDSPFWLMIDKSEFTVGYGLNHTHFSESYNNLEDGIIQAFDLLTNTIKTTEYIKGKTVYKVTTEIEFPNSQLINIGTSAFLVYPFWKKTKIKNSLSEKIIEKKEIEEDVHFILNER